MADTTSNTAHRFVCGACSEHSADCVCEVEAAPRMCESCALAPVFEGCDQCVACIASYCLHEDPADLEMLRRVHAGTRWLVELEAEVTRQQSALKGSSWARVAA